MEKTMICRCEEISEEEIREAVVDGARSITGVKRRTGAGMGLCQGRGCRKLVVAIIVQDTGINPADIEPPTARSPVRPVLIEALVRTE